MSLFSLLEKNGGFQGTVAFFRKIISHHDCESLFF